MPSQAFPHETGHLIVGGGHHDYPGDILELYWGKGSDLLGMVRELVFNGPLLLSQNLLGVIEGKMARVTALVSLANVSEDHPRMFLKMFGLKEEGPVVIHNPDLIKMEARVKGFQLVGKELFNAGTFTKPATYTGFGFGAAGVIGGGGGVTGAGSGGGTGY